MSAPPAGLPRRPNVVVILADDMGHGDVSSYGNRLVETTHIDGIGRDGVRFTAGYSSAPLCSPSRAGLVTGRYQQRFGFEQQVSSGAFPERREVRLDDGSLAPLQGEAEFLRRGIPLSERNFGELFSAAGYHTAVIGKWHLGHGPDFVPHRRGFKHSVVFYGNTSLQATNPEDPSFFSLKVDFHDEAADTAWTRAGLNQIRRDGEIVEVDEYLMFYFRDRAVDYVRERARAAEPFLLYFPMNSPVPPLQVPRSYFEALRPTIPNIAQRGYNAMLKAQDDVVGAVLQALREAGVENDTFVIFVSDNGCALSRPGSNAPFSGGKYTTLEGGIRMPFVMKWPGRIPAGRILPAGQHAGHPAHDRGRLRRVHLGVAAARRRRPAALSARREGGRTARGAVLETRRLLGRAHGTLEALSGAAQRHRPALRPGARPGRTA